MYLDAAYIVKMYINDHGSDAVRTLVRNSGPVTSSELSIAEVNCAIYRRWRTGGLSLEECRENVAVFARHRAAGLWNFTPVTTAILLQTQELTFLPPGRFLRSADTIHLLTARQLGESEIWTNDRHMLSAAPYFGLTGRSV